MILDFMILVTLRVAILIGEMMGDDLMDEIEIVAEEVMATKILHSFVSW